MSDEEIVIGRVLARLLKVVEWLEMATTDPTVPSCVIQSEIDDYSLELRSVYEELMLAARKETPDA